MFDYADWIRKAKTFSESASQLADDFGEVSTEIEVKPPLDEAVVRRVVSNTELHVPKELQNFWTRASRSNWSAPLNLIQ